MLFIYARTAVLNDKSMFVDELNIKLHPLLLKFIIDLFYEGDSKAQLIYTTHDTTLMDKKFFRRDQILFVQKDEFGYSELFALSDFKVRSDASFEKDYLAGVYGGIPFIKDFDLKEGGVDGF
jgi:AAA15 family ATPase/GTPase